MTMIFEYATGWSTPEYEALVAKEKRGELTLAEEARLYEMEACATARVVQYEEEAVCWKYF